MTTRPRLATLAFDTEKESEIAAAATRRDDLVLVLRCVDRAEVLAVLRGGDIDVLLCVGVPSWLDARLMEEAQLGDVRVIGTVKDPLDAEQLRRIGGLLVPPDVATEEILEMAISAVDAPVPDPDPVALRPADRGRMIAVWGPKGSPGRTSLCIELASEFAVADPDTVLVDADLYGGDVAQLLALNEELPTIVWAAQKASKSELTAEVLSTALRRAGPGGPVVLPGIQRADLWTNISDFGWRTLADALTASFRFVICDTAFSIQEAPTAINATDRDRIARLALSEADLVVAVCRGDPVGIKSFLWAAQDLDGLVDLDKVVLVANRVKPGDEREIAYVLQRHLGKRPRVYIPDRPAEFAQAVEAGTSVRSLKPASDVARVVADLAATLGVAVQPSGFLSKLAGRV